MDALTAIFTRRSVRHFTAEAVSSEQIEILLRAAMAAPTSGNAQDWRFVVIQERPILEAVTKFHPYSAMLHEAPLAILVCGDAGAEKNPGRYALDAAAAMENLLLAAHASGLGAVWLAVWPDEKRMAGMTGLLGLPERVIPVAMAAVGHPAEQPAPIDRFDPDKIHYNHW